MTKFVPLTVKGNAAPPTIALAGDSVVIVGGVGVGVGVGIPSVTATQGENSEVFAARGTEGISSLAKVVTLPMVALGGKTMVKVKAALPSLSVRTDREFCVSRLLVGWFGEGVGLGGVGGALVQSEVR